MNTILENMSELGRHEIYVGVDKIKREEIRKTSEIMYAIFETFCTLAYDKRTLSRNVVHDKRQFYIRTKADNDK